jgi:hypothetical protein
MINVEKGMAGIRTTDVPLTAFVCPSTLKLKHLTSPKKSIQIY